MCIRDSLTAAIRLTVIASEALDKHVGELILTAHEDTLHRYEDMILSLIHI